MNWLVYLCYPLMLLFLLFGSKWHGRGQWNEDFFSLEQTKHWQGFFTVCILLHHVAQRISSPTLKKDVYLPGLEPFRPVGFFFVAFFLLCSGYGLYVSWKRKPGYLKGFFRRRVLPIVVAFYITEWLFLVVRLLLGEQMSPATVLWYVLGLQQANGSSWFAIALPVFYLMFWLCFRFIKRESAAIGGVFACIGLWIFLGCIIGNNKWLLCGEWWYNTALFFPLGMLLAKHRETFVCTMRKHYWPVLVLSAVLCALLFVCSSLAIKHIGYTGRGIASMWLRALRRFVCMCSQTGAAAMFALAATLAGMKLSIGNRALSVMGGITLEFYLIHMLYVEMFRDHFFTLSPNPLYIHHAFFYPLAAGACALASALLLRKLLHPRQPMLPGSK